MTDSEESANLPDALLRMAELTFDNRGRAYGKPTENRKRIAEHLETLGQYIQAISRAIREDKPLCDSCLAPENYREMSSSFSDIIGLENAEKLTRVLESACHRTLLTALAQSPKREAYLEFLKEASSIFQAVASYIRAL